MEYHMYSALQAIVSCLPLHLIYQAEQNNIAGNPLLGHLFPTHIDCKNLPRQMTWTDFLLKVDISALDLAALFSLQQQSAS